MLSSTVAKYLQIGGLMKWTPIVGISLGPLDSGNPPKQLVKMKKNKCYPNGMVSDEPCATNVLLGTELDHESIQNGVFQAVISTSNCQFWAIGDSICCSPGSFLNR
jgi:hypothetical protein